MSTPAQIAANQSNARLSAGPVTEAGKAASSQNNLRHALRGQFKVFDDESQAEFDALVQALNNEYQPADYIEDLLVDHMAAHEWRARRTAANIDRLNIQTPEPDLKRLALYLRYQTHYTRSFHKCMNDLLKLRAEKRRDQIGFERQKLAAAAEARKQATAEARNRQMESRSAARELATAIKSARHFQLPAVQTSNQQAKSAPEHFVSPGTSAQLRA